MTEPADRTVTAAAERRHSSAGGGGPTGGRTPTPTSRSAPMTPICAPCRKATTAGIEKLGAGVPGCGVGPVFLDTRSGVSWREASEQGDAHQTAARARPTAISHAGAELRWVRGGGRARSAERE
eukprot:CAMPEP_0185381106 /NCGR_PEP_ID=MMETSP1364-20130426/51951_1 /TAXON_ID=38817 /ORGANISM="Gephyrocapsa oceanica, Strain RCC1303" /LENGTH=123 /DNA_ID=CAMNT_0027982757 /DNA_START=24 /DNA_END=396 /DNA_ORIENTATION=-